MKQNNLKIIDTILFLKKFYEHLKKIIYKNTFLIKGLSLKTRIYTTPFYQSVSVHRKKSERSQC